MDILRPSSRYGIRLYVLITIVGIVLLSIGIVLAWILSADWTRAVFVNRALQAYVTFIFLGYLLSLWFAHRYYLSMVYEWNAEEIKLQRGIWMQNVQLIPLRNVTGVMLKRDFFDRCLEIGTLQFMLVGSPGTKMGVVSFVGLSDVEAQYRKISDLLVYEWGKSKRQPDSSMAEAHIALVNMPIDHP